MNLIFKYLLRSIRQKKIRTSIIILSLILTSAMLFININARTITQDSYENNIRNKFGTVDLVITKKSPFSNPYFEKEEIQLNDENIANAVGFMSSFGVFSDDKEKKSRVNIVSADIDSLIQTDLIDFSRPFDISTFQGKKIIISDSQAKKYGVSIGDKIEVTILDKRIPFEVVTTVESSGLFSDENSAFNMILPLEEMNSIMGTENMISGLFVDMLQEENIYSELSALERQNKEFDVTPTLDKETFNYLMSNISTILIFALLLTMLVSTVVILSLYKHVLDERMPVMGTLRSIGVTRNKTVLVLILENSLYGLIGGVIGILIGLLLLNSFMETLIGSMEHGLEISNGWSLISIIITLVFSLGWAVMITLTSIIKMRKMSLKDSIFQTVHTVRKFKKVELILGLISIIFGFILFSGKIMDRTLAINGIATLLLIIGFILVIPAFLHFFISVIVKLSTNYAILSQGAKSVRNNKVVLRNIQISVVTLGLSISIFSVMGTVNDFFTFATKSFQFDVIIGVDQDVQKDYDEINDLNGVDSLYNLYHEKGKIQWEDVESDIKIIGRTGDDSFNQFINGTIELYNYDLSDLKDNEIVLDKHLMETLGTDVGKTVDILYEEKSYEFTIAGTMDSGRFSSDRTTSLISLDSFKSKFTDIPETIYVKGNESVTADELNDTIADYLLDTMSTVHTKQEFFSMQKANNDALLAIVQSALVFGLIVGALGIVNNIVVGYIVRKKEFAILYSTSMSKRHLKKSLVFEALFMAIIVVVLAFVFSILMIYSLAQLLESANVMSNLSYPPLQASFILGGGFFTLMLSVIISFKIVNRMNVFEELRSE